MGWFNEQIKTRIHTDDAGFEGAFVSLSSVVLGRKILAQTLSDDGARTRTAMEEILRYYHVKPAEIPDNVTDLDEQIECLLRPEGIMKRAVKLTGKWYRDGAGALLGRTRAGENVALIPHGVSGYAFIDPKTGARVAVNKKTAELLEDEAYCFYRPLPLRALGIGDLIRYIVTTLAPSDYIMIILSTLAVTLIGLLSPYANAQLFSRVIPSGEQSLLLPITALLLGVTLSTAMITVTKTLIMTRLKTKLNVAVQSAAMARLLSLPATFFREYASGDLAGRANGINNLCTMLLDAVLSTGLSSLFSLMYVSQITRYAPALVAPAMVVILVTLALSAASVLVQMRITKKRLEVSNKLSGMVYALFSGIQKIKLGGAEKRAFTRWADVYKQDAQLAYAPPLFIKLGGVITSLVTMLGTVLIYFSAAKSGVSTADYMAFNVTYGMVSGAFLSLSGLAMTIANIKPVLDMVSPILKAVPEVSKNKKMVTRLSGLIELNNVSFRYTPAGPLIIDDLSLKIRPGQYVAIVGSTGCGKSTLLRLMLGFETPDKGAVYYDGKDVDKLDMKSLRRHIGCVIQNGKLFTGSIFDNIVISAPWLSLEDAWAAAELAGLADDIRAMPMGMHTIVTEGGGGISGGQKQRLLIARAVAPKPKILMFDEATSALDNLTQKQVSQSLDRLKSTRIVIAHRLSTIKQCDRIIVLDKGRIVEDGTYDKLVEQNGFFADLVRRQQLDTHDKMIAKTTLF